MWLYDNSKLKYSPAFTEPLEKTGWHFQLLASKGQLVHSEGPSWEVSAHKAGRSARGRRLEAFSQRSWDLQGSTSQSERKTHRQRAQSSLAEEIRTNPAGMRERRWRKHQREAHPQGLEMAEEESRGGSEGQLPQPGQGSCSEVIKGSDEKWQMLHEEIICSGAELLHWSADQRQQVTPNFMNTCFNSHWCQWW